MSKILLSTIVNALCLNKTTKKTNHKQMNRSADIFFNNPFLHCHPTTATTMNGRLERQIGRQPFIDHHLQQTRSLA